MKMAQDKLAKIGLCALGATPSKDFSKEDYKAAFDGEMANRFACKNMADFLRIKPDLFQVLQEIADDYIPTRLIQSLGSFAEIRQVAQGQKFEFDVRKGRLRGKGFVTQVTPAGQYETFRLDQAKITLPVKAFGGQALVDWERYLNGEESYLDLIQLIAEGIEDKMYMTVQDLLIASASNAARPAANMVSETAFDDTKMQSLVNVVRAYGTPVIWCSPEFAATMSNQIALANANPNIPSSDLEEIKRMGYIGQYRGAPVIVLPQSFLDEENTEKVMDPEYAYVIPVDKEKIVKVVLEGDTQIKEFSNRDWSTELSMYKKIGAGIVTTPNFWGIYRNSGL